MPKIISSIPQTCLSVLKNNNTNWMTIKELAVEVQKMHPELQPDLDKLKESIGSARTNWPVDVKQGTNLDTQIRMKFSPEREQEQMNQQKNTTPLNQKRKFDKEKLSRTDQIRCKTFYIVCTSLTGAGYEFQVDHVNPVSGGGNHEPDNFALMPIGWNQAKSNTEWTRQPWKWQRGILEAHKKMIDEFGFPPKSPEEKEENDKLFRYCLELLEKAYDRSEKFAEKSEE